MIVAGEYIAGILCCRGGRGSSQASSHTSQPSHDDSDPPLYARWVNMSLNIILKNSQIVYYNILATNISVILLNRKKSVVIKLDFCH